MTPAVSQHLVRGAAEIGRPLTESELAALRKLAALLREWNKKINLTSDDSEQAIVDKHFLDSIAAAQSVDNAMGVVDVGSGAGFPGLIIALLHPKVAVTTVEPIHKKVAFTRTAARELGLANLRATADRDDVLAAKKETFDLAISRATFDPAEWTERGARLVNEAGRLAAMVVASHPALTTPPGFIARPPIAYRIENVAREIRIFARG